MTAGNCSRHATGIKLAFSSYNYRYLGIEVFQKLLYNVINHIETSFYNNVRGSSYMLVDVSHQSSVKLKVILAQVNSKL